MKRFHTLIGMIVSFTLMTFITGCGGGSTSDITSGTATMNITDAPVDDENVLGVHVAFDAVHYKPAGSQWVVEELNETRVINLLDLQDGNSTLLTAQTELPVGRINQIRFIINPAKTFIELAGDINETLTVPSQIEKVVGGFVVPAGGDINITADFDLRKSLVLENKGYKLKPTIKIVDNSQVGEVSGTVANVDGNTTVIVYAYANDTFIEADEKANDFANAATSSDATDGKYTLAWLAAGTYDLVVVEFDVNGENPIVLGTVQDVVITENVKETQDIDIQAL
ncbi:DUF4382 domain-containing protein [Sulfurovum sp. XGS-02]|uniref:DUF4382 domain-containing protein n=1 Tax=Sulfurovum sp. XGS-02 TaxID=2925411 RepID=UPI00206BAE9C|nr:DUF4382 domain-containing protein [Sulfurovum sp. XGS-02]UPT76626.1 DUF4382 domain-containing protein [Sulfurovum sp. XGS-02]